MKYLKIIFNDLKTHLLENDVWHFYAFLIWLIGGSLLLHYINPWMSDHGMNTTPGAEPFSMLLISVIISFIGVVGWYVYEYIKSVINRGNK